MDFELEELLSVLTPKEEKVIDRLYALSGGEPVTCRALGAELNLSGARIWQIKKEAFARLRRYVASSRYGYLERERVVLFRTMEIRDVPEAEVITLPPPEAPKASTNGEVENEDDFFYLSTPISVDGKELKRLRLNPKGVLSGRAFFSLIQRYQRKFPDEARTNFNKFTNENFLSLVLAAINKIAPEDLYKIDYLDLPLLFLRAASFHFSGGRTATTPEKEEEEK
jgi:hypothetical protein